jgi:hypothetical protein
MRALIKLSLLLVLLGLGTVTTLFWFALSDTPRVTQSAVLSHEDIARARSILKRHDPRRLPPGTRRTIEISAQDLNLASDYLLQKIADGDARLSLTTGRLALQVTLRLPPLPARRYLNIEGTLEAPDGQPTVSRLQIGRLPVPATLARVLVRKLLEYWYEPAQLDAAAGLIQDLRLLPDQLRLTYLWTPGLLDQARDTLLTSHDRAALAFYHGQLLQLQAQGIGREGSLVDLLQPLFAAARQRSRELDPVAENTALLTVLGTWASRRDTRKLIPGSQRRPQRFRLRLEGRADFAQHFLASAALAARGDSILSDAVGLFKEISDSGRGSGFSFADIAADRAGTRFGELASRSAEDAARLQRRLAAGVAETDIMPPATDLPEQMDAQAFKARFSHVGSPAYERMMLEIERRIDTCSLYRD